jgi:hypothetical protein
MLFRKRLWKKLFFTEPEPWYIRGSFLM